MTVITKGPWKSLEDFEAAERQRAERSAKVWTKRREKAAKRATKDAARIAKALEKATRAADRAARKADRDRKFEVAAAARLAKRETKRALLDAPKPRKPTLKQLNREAHQRRLARAAAPPAIPPLPYGLPPLPY